MSTRIRPFVLDTLIIVAAWFGVTTSHAADMTLYSAGDPSTSSYSYSDIAFGGQNDFEHYQQFSVPGGNLWTINGLFSHIVTDGVTPSSINLAHYEIRQNVSEGNGGTLLYSGDVAITGTDDHLSTGNGEVYLYTGMLPTGLSLGAGTYWMDLTPYSSSGTNLFVATTNGNNAVDQTANATNYLTFVFNGNTSYRFHNDGFTSAVGLLGVPEPSTWALVGAGIAVGAATTQRARRRARGC